jgi:hypothetical protein
MHQMPHVNTSICSKKYTKFVVSDSELKREQLLAVASQIIMKVCTEFPPASQKGCMVNDKHPGCSDTYIFELNHRHIDITSQKFRITRVLLLGSFF